MGSLDVQSSCDCARNGVNTPRENFFAVFRLPLMHKGQVRRKSRRQGLHGAVLVIPQAGICMVPVCIAHQGEELGSCHSQQPVSATRSLGSRRRRGDELARTFPGSRGMLPLSGLKVVSRTGHETTLPISAGELRKSCLTDCSRDNFRS